MRCSLAKFAESATGYDRAPINTISKSKRCQSYLPKTNPEKLGASGLLNNHGAGKCSDTLHQNTVCQEDIHPCVMLRQGYLFIPYKKGKIVIPYTIILIRSSFFFYSL